MKRFVFFTVLFFAVELFAASPLEFLEIPASPVAHVFGGNPAVNMPASVFLNPSSNCARRRPEVSASAVFWLENIKTQQFCFSFPLFSGFSASGMYFAASYGKIPGYSFLDNPTGDIIPSSALFGAALSRKLFGFEVGAGFLKIKESLSSEDFGEASAVSVGVGKKISFAKVGASLFVPSGRIKYGDFSAPQEISPIMRFGVSAKISRFMIETGFVSSSGLRLVYGVSASISNALKIMAGSGSSSQTGAVFGAQINLGDTSFSYSFSPAVWGNSISEISVKIRFGPSNLKNRLLEQGKKLFNLGYYEKARKKFEDVLILDPSNVSAKFFIAKISEILSPSSASPTKE